MLLLCVIFTRSPSANPRETKSVPVVVIVLPPVPQVNASPVGVIVSTASDEIVRATDEAFASVVSAIVPTFTTRFATYV